MSKHYAVHMKLKLNVNSIQKIKVFLNINWSSKMSEPKAENLLVQTSYKKREWHYPYRVVAFLQTSISQSLTGIFLKTYTKSSLTFLSAFIGFFGWQVLFSPYQNCHIFENVHSILFTEYIKSTHPTFIKQIRVTT